MRRAPTIIATWPSHIARSPGNSAVVTGDNHQPRARHSSSCGRSAPSVVSSPCPVKQRFVAEPGADLAMSDSPPPWRFPGVVTSFES